MEVSFKVYYLLDLVCLDRVVEVRCGQQTKNFVKFPYTEVESQSFSLMFEKQQGNLITCASTGEHIYSIYSGFLMAISGK